MKSKSPRQPFTRQHATEETIVRRVAEELDRFMKAQRVDKCPRKACKRAGACRAARIADCPGRKASSQGPERNLPVDGLVSSPGEGLRG